MTKSTRYTRTSALPAIAAALALSSTPLLAQEAQPVPVDQPPAPTQSVPATEPTAAVPDTSTTASPTTDAGAAASDAAQTNSAPTMHTKTVKHAKTALKSPVQVTSRVAARTTSTHVKMPHVQGPAMAAAAPPPAAAPASRSQSSVTPVVNLSAKQQPGPTTQQLAARPVKHNNTVPIAAGGVLALLAIGSAAVAMNRRRHEDDEEWADENPNNSELVARDSSHDPEPDEMNVEPQPAIVAPPVSAFQWEHNERARADRAEEPLAEADDRKPGETWVERAYRGSSALNPSVSLKARLKRAVFFDKRERDAAAGLAEPVDPAAGLPERMMEEGQNSELV